MDCNVCYENINYGIYCFGKCNFVVCHNCFINLLKLNIVDCVEYCCPMCRFTSIKNKDKRFTRFINHNKKVLNKIVELYEAKLEKTNTRVLTNAWNEFTIHVNQTPMIFPNQVVDNHN